MDLRARQNWFCYLEQGLILLALVYYSECNNSCPWWAGDGVQKVSSRIFGAELFSGWKSSLRNVPSLSWLMITFLHESWYSDLNVNLSFIN